MNIDEALHSSLQTVAREVSVTPEQLVHAEHRFIHRREQGAVRRRWGTGLVAAAAVSGLVLAGAVGWRELQEGAAPQPAAPGPQLPTELPVSVDNLAGIWLTHDASGWLWSFHRNGTVSFFNPTYQAVSDEVPVPYAVTDTGIELPDDLCDWSLQITDDGRMVGSVVPVPDSDGGCTGGDRVSWIRLSPRSDVGAAVVYTGWREHENSEAARWHRSPTPVTRIELITRAWMQQGTGRLLVVTTPDGAEGGRYVLDDDGELLTSPDDVGEVAMDDAGNLVLTSSDESQGCPVGSTVFFQEPVLRGTGGTIPPNPAPALDLTPGPHECSQHAELGGIWVQVS
ncbi:hypothetical protein [Ornithinimicrobium sp. W1665]|uniref:hypothetical protein n=1 Tax=Ornithinimicrobium sp. W1665 TaxID=3416666 RepID=UPI003CF3C15E